MFQTKFLFSAQAKPHGMMWNQQSKPFLGLEVATSALYPWIFTTRECAFFKLTMAFWPPPPLTSGLDPTELQSTTVSEGGWVTTESWAFPILFSPVDEENNLFANPHFVIDLGGDCFIYIRRRKNTLRQLTRWSQGHYCPLLWSKLYDRKT